MLLQATPLAGLHVLSLEPRADERGFFARSFCQDTFARHGLAFSIRQSNISQNKRKATLRGMHIQIAPREEAKLVRCTRGRIFDVAVDVRPASETFGQWFGLELSSENHKALFIPAGFAHGFQTLEDDSEVFYEMGETYAPDLQRGLHWADPDVGIHWPLPRPILSERDGQLPGLSQFRI